MEAARATLARRGRYFGCATQIFLHTSQFTARTPRRAHHTAPAPHFAQHRDGEQERDRDSHAGRASHDETTRKQA